MDSWSWNPGGSFGGFLYCVCQKDSESRGLGSRPGQDNVLRKLLYSHNVSSHPWIYMDAYEFSGNLTECWGVTLRNKHPIHGTTSCFMQRKPGEAGAGWATWLHEYRLPSEEHFAVTLPLHPGVWVGEVGGEEGGGDLQWTVIPSREVSMHIHTL